jgi:hypothetical protein
MPRSDKGIGMALQEDTLSVAATASHASQYLGLRKCRRVRQPGKDKMRWRRYRGEVPDAAPASKGFLRF